MFKRTLIGVLYVLPRHVRLGRKKCKQNKKQKKIIKKCKQNKKQKKIIKKCKQNKKQNKSKKISEKHKH
jgi:hypothetical protein